MNIDRYETVTSLRVAHSDERGRIINVFQGELHHVATVERKAGSVFAEHYHPGSWHDGEQRWAGNVQRMTTRDHGKAERSALPHFVSTGWGGLTC